MEGQALGGLGGQLPQLPLGGAQDLLLVVLGLRPGVGEDLLGLGPEARMNTPSTLGNNWKWRALPGAYDEKLSRQLYREMQVYQRLPKA